MLEKILNSYKKLVGVPLVINLLLTGAGVDYALYTKAFKKDAITYEYSKKEQEDTIEGIIVNEPKRFEVRDGKSWTFNKDGSKNYGFVWELEIKTPEGTIHVEPFCYNPDKWDFKQGSKVKIDFYNNQPVIRLVEGSAVL